MASSIQLSIKARLYVNLAVLVIALAVVCGAGLHAFGEASARMEKLYQQNLLSISHIDEVFQRSLQSQQLRLEAYVHQNPTYTARNYEQVKVNRGRINELMEQFEKAELGDAERSLAAEVRAQRTSIVDAGKKEIELLLAGDYEGAKKVRVEQIEPVIVRMDATTTDLVDHRRRAAETLLADSERELASQRLLMLLSFAGALVIAVWFAWMNANHIGHGLARAQEVASRVGRGELGTHIEVDQRDEIGDVLRSLKLMDERLLQTVHAVSGSAAEIDRAAQQLSSGSDELSERTQEQAAALEETAASMEEMAATVKNNADNALSANQIASAARIQADQGGSIVQQAVAAMTEITTASKRIADILTVIDEIAFQTNLLALNAAVEAARAGEQGRGFAIVAGEVRNLAQRSASAAQEIKGLIGDTVAKVNAGSSLVSASGKTLDDIVIGVKRVTDIVAEMAAATSEQSTGIEQINHAVSNMDGATQQNAALVEESAAAAKLMQQQAAQLQSLIGFFRLEGAAAHATSAGSTGSRFNAAARPERLDRAA